MITRSSLTAVALCMGLTICPIASAQVQTRSLSSADLLAPSDLILLPATPYPDAYINENSGSEWRISLSSYASGAAPARTELGQNIHARGRFNLYMVMLRQLIPFWAPSESGRLAIGYSVLPLAGCDRARALLQARAPMDQWDALALQAYNEAARHAANAPLELEVEYPAFVISIDRIARRISVGNTGDVDPTNQYGGYMDINSSGLSTEMREEIQGRNGILFKPPAVSCIWHTPGRGTDGSDYLVLTNELTRGPDYMWFELDRPISHRDISISAEAAAALQPGDRVIERVRLRVQDHSRVLAQWARDGGLVVAILPVQNQGVTLHRPNGESLSP